jgi:hypothetical protein
MKMRGGRAWHHAAMHRQAVVSTHPETVDRAAKALYQKWCRQSGAGKTWEELLADPSYVTSSGQAADFAVALWRDWARAALEAAVTVP